MAKPNVQFYSDRAMKNELTQFVFPRTEIGEDSTIFFYMFNTSKKWPLKKITPLNLPAETELIDLPKTMKADETKEVQFKWSPTINVDEPLKTTLEIDASKWIG